MPRWAYLALAALAVIAGGCKAEEATKLQKGDYQTSPGPPGADGAPPTPTTK